MNLSSANAMLACICIHIKDASARALTAIDQPLPQEEGHRAVSPHLHTDSFVGKSTTYRQLTVALIANVKPQSAQERLSAAAVRHLYSPRLPHYLAAPPVSQRICQESNIVT